LRKETRKEMGKRKKSLVMGVGVGKGTGEVTGLGIAQRQERKLGKAKSLVTEVEKGTGKVMELDIVKRDRKADWERDR